MTRTDALPYTHTHTHVQPPPTNLKSHHSSHTPSLFCSRAFWVMSFSRPPTYHLFCIPQVLQTAHTPTHVYTIYPRTHREHTHARTHFHKQTFYFGAKAKTNTLDLKLDHNTHKQSSVVATVLYFYFPLPYQTHAIGKHRSAGEQRGAETNAACLR